MSIDLLLQLHKRPGLHNRYLLCSHVTVPSWKMCSINLYHFCHLLSGKVIPRIISYCQWSRIRPQSGHGEGIDCESSARIPQVALRYGGGSLVFRTGSSASQTTV